MYSHSWSIQMTGQRIHRPCMIESVIYQSRNYSLKSSSYTCSEIIFLNDRVSLDESRLLLKVMHPPSHEYASKQSCMHPPSLSFQITSISWASNNKILSNKVTFIFDEYAVYSPNGDLDFSWICSGINTLDDRVTSNLHLDTAT